MCAVVGDQFAEDGESGSRSGDGVVDDAQIVPAAPEICGCTISVRNSEDILSVWNKGTDAKINARIRCVLLPPIYPHLRYSDALQQGYHQASPQFTAEYNHGV